MKIKAVSPAASQKNLRPAKSSTSPATRERIGLRVNMDLIIIPGKTLEG
jgi:hypothetical protein